MKTRTYVFKKDRRTCRLALMMSAFACGAFTCDAQMSHAAHHHHHHKHVSTSSDIQALALELESSLWNATVAHDFLATDALFATEFLAASDTDMFTRDEHLAELADTTITSYTITDLTAVLEHDDLLVISYTLTTVSSDFDNSEVINAPKLSVWKLHGNNWELVSTTPFSSIA